MTARTPCRSARGWARVQPAALRHLRLATSRRSPASRPSTSRRSSRCRSSPATRSSASCWTTCDDLPAGHPHRRSSRSSAAPPAGSSPVPNCAAGAVRPLRPRHDRPPRAPACRPATAPTPAAAGASMFVAHRSQLHAVPERAVATRRPCCSSRSRARPHRAPRATCSRTANVARHRRRHRRASSRCSRCKELTNAGQRRSSSAKHPQQREWAERVRRRPRSSRPERGDRTRSAASTGAMKLKPERGAAFLLGGVDVAIDCVGSQRALDLALRTTRAGGRVVRDRHPDRGRRPHAALVPRARARRRLHGRVRDRRHGERRHSFDLATCDRHRDRRSTGSSARPTRSAAGARRSTTRSAPGELGTLKVAFDPRLD